MAGIHSLPPELLIEIFVAAGSKTNEPPIRSWAYNHGFSATDPLKSTGIYSIATASKQMYAVFKAHEHHIFSGIAHQLLHQLSDKSVKSWVGYHYIPDFTLAVRLACLARMVRLPDRPTGHDVIENIITRVNDMDISDILRPSLYRGILDYLRSREFVWLLEAISNHDGMRLEMCWMKHIPHGFRDNLPMAGFWMRYSHERCPLNPGYQRIGEHDAVFGALIYQLSSSDRETQDNNNETRDNAVETRDNEH